MFVSLGIAMPTLPSIKYLKFDVFFGAWTGVLLRHSSPARLLLLLLLMSNFMSMLAQS